MGRIVWFVFLISFFDFGVYKSLRIIGVYGMCFWFCLDREIVGEEIIIIRLKLVIEEGFSSGNSKYLDDKFYMDCIFKK